MLVKDVIFPLKCELSGVCLIRPISSCLCSGFWVGCTSTTWLSSTTVGFSLVQCSRNMESFEGLGERGRRRNIRFQKCSTLLKTGVNTLKYINSHLLLICQIFMSLRKILFYVILCMLKSNLCFWLLCYFCIVK